MLMSSKQLKEHYAKLSRLGCVLCAHLGHDTTDQPVEIHHLRRFGMKREDAPALPLCAGHHRHFKDSVHQLGAKGFEKHWGFGLEEKLKDVEKLIE